MASALNSIKLSTQIFAGFGAIMAICIVLALFAVNGTRDARGFFIDFFTLAERTVLYAGLSEDLFEARSASLKYRISQSDAHSNEVISNLEEVLAERENLIRDASSPEYAAKYEDLLAKAEQYKAGFSEFSAAKMQIDTFIDEKLKIGPETAQKITTVMDAALKRSELNQVYAAGKAQASFLLGRHDVARYLNLYDPKLVDAAIARFETSTNALNTLLEKLPVGSEYHVIVKAALDGVTLYVDAFIGAKEAIAKRDDLAYNTLDVVGPELQSAFENLYDANVVEQVEIGPVAKAGIDATITNVVIISVVCVVLGLVIAVALGRMISGAIRKITANMNLLASGEKDFEVFGTNKTNEIGEMAKALQVFRDNAVEIERMEEERRKTEEQRAEERRSMMLQMADDFESRVGAAVTAVAEAANNINEASNGISESVTESRAQSTAVAAAAEEASANVQNVASATEELSASVDEISGTVTRAADMARSSADMAGTSEQQLDALTSAISEVDQVIGSINEVAEQTNLLALNATIEAARAGELGKGFAVVASEVKDLATQTKKMTDDIATKLAAVRGSAEGAIEATRTIISQVQEIDQTTTTIAASVDQQAGATGEISRSTQEAASGTQEVSNNVQGISEAADATEKASLEMQQASKALSGTADDLQHEMTRFLDEIRAA